MVEKQFQNKKIVGERVEVSEQNSGNRLDVFLKAAFKERSRTFLQRLIAKGYVSVNGDVEKASHIVSVGDAVEVIFPAPEPSILEPAPIELDILFEDDEIIVLNKPAGLVVHPAHGHRNDTLVNALLHYNPALSSIGGVQRPGIVHRLDKDTSGVMVVAKNDEAHRKLSKQFKSRTVRKTYLCYVRGKLNPQSGKVDKPIGRDLHNRKKYSVSSENGKEAVSVYKTLQVYPLVSFVEVTIKTGRTHQIRVHMASEGCPLVGDRVYGRSWMPTKAPIDLQNYLKRLDRVMLHSHTITITHPTSDHRMEFVAELPSEFKDFSDLLERL